MCLDHRGDAHPNVTDFSLQRIKAFFVIWFYIHPSLWEKGSLGDGL